MTRFGVGLAIACVFLVGCATAQTEPPTVNVTGTWDGEYFGARSGPMILTLQQAGANVTGSQQMTAANEYDGPITGRVSGNNFSYIAPGGGGDLTVQGNSMTGTSARGFRLNLKRR